MNMKLHYILGKVSQIIHLKENRVILKFLARSIKIKHLDLAWCDPRSIELSTRYFVHKKRGFLFSQSEIPKSKINYKESDFVSYGKWDQKVVPILDVKAISRTIRRFSENLDWYEVVHPEQLSTR
ncbi:hypothetical protein [Roseinatronobacter sp.]|uniref:hypothetical protein n=1 Tax=Roseinatronobacter sp. TaxID=1945755 RepID=UPI003F6FA9BC